MSAYFNLELPPSCGAGNILNPQALTELGANVCVPVKEHVMRPADALAIGGAILGIMIAGALFAGRKGGAS